MNDHHSNTLHPSGLNRAARRRVAVVIRGERKGDKPSEDTTVKQWKRWVEAQR